MGIKLVVVPIFVGRARQLDRHTDRQTAFKKGTKTLDKTDRD